MANDVVRDSVVIGLERWEIERLKAVIRTKDACLFNFARTLRSADERARAAEERLQPHEGVPTRYEGPLEARL